VFDRGFADFSKRLKIKSIREWEERRAAALERHASERLRLETQVRSNHVSVSGASATNAGALLCVCTVDTSATGQCFVSWSF